MFHTNPAAGHWQVAAGIHITAQILRFKRRKKDSPSSDGGIEREGDEEAAGTVFIRLNPERLLLEVDVVADGDGLLVLDVGRGHGRLEPVGVPPGPAGVVVGVDGGRELRGGHVGRRRGAPVVVVVGCREGHLHRRRRRRVVVPVLRVVLRRVGVGVLRRVRRGGGEDVAVGGGLRLLGRRGRLVVVAVAVAGAPAAVARAASPAVAARVAHAPARADHQLRARGNALRLGSRGPGASKLEEPRPPPNSSPPNVPKKSKKEKKNPTTTSIRSGATESEPPIDSPLADRNRFDRGRGVGGEGRERLPARSHFFAFSSVSYFWGYNGRLRVKHTTIVSFLSPRWLQLWLSHPQPL